MELGTGGMNLPTIASPLGLRMTHTAFGSARAALVARSTAGMASCTYTSRFPGLSREYSNTKAWPSLAGRQVISSPAAGGAFSILSPSLRITCPAIGGIVRTLGVDSGLSQQSQQHTRTGR